MSDAEIERLFRAIESLREDLHKMDVKIVKMEEQERARGMTKAEVYKILGLATMVISTATAVITNLLGQM